MKNENNPTKAEKGPEPLKGKVAKECDDDLTIENVKSAVEWAINRSHDVLLTIRDKRVFKALIEEAFEDVM